MIRDIETYSTLTPTESAVIQLDEQGLTPRQIAAKLEISRANATRIINEYSYRTCWNTSDKFDAMIRAGDARYAAALASTGKRYA